MKASYLWFTAILAPKDTSDPLSFIVGLLVILAVVFVIAAMVEAY